MEYPVLHLDLHPQARTERLLQGGVSRMKIIKYPTFEPSACPSCGTVFQVEVGDDIEVRTSATTGEKRHVCYCPSCNVAVHLQALGVVDSQTDDIPTDDVAQAIVVETEKYNELREALVDFVCSGVHNPAPYCKNRCDECVDDRGWCTYRRCNGFNPDGTGEEQI